MVTRLHGYIVTWVAWLHGLRGCMVTLDFGGSYQNGGVGIWLAGRMADAEQFLVEHAHHVAPDLVGIALGVELCLDIGPLRPGPELLLFLRIGLGLKDGQPALRHAQPASADVPSAQGDDITTKLAQAAE